MYFLTLTPRNSHVDGGWFSRSSFNFISLREKQHVFPSWPFLYHPPCVLRMGRPFIVLIIHHSAIDWVVGYKKNISGTMLPIRPSFPSSHPRSPCPSDPFILSGYRFWICLSKPCQYKQVWRPLLMLKFTPCTLVKKKDGFFVRVRADSYLYISNCSRLIVSNQEHGHDKGLVAGPMDAQLPTGSQQRTASAHHLEGQQQFLDSTCLVHKRTRAKVLKLGCLHMTPSLSSD